MYKYVMVNCVYIGLWDTDFMVQGEYSSGSANRFMVLALPHSDPKKSVYRFNTCIK